MYIVTVCLAGVGLFYPRLSAALGFFYSLGRVLYARGYMTKKGSDGRMVGVIIADVAVLVTFGYAIYIGCTTTNLAGIVKGYLGK
jgi:hypothetical protein